MIALFEVSIREDKENFLAAPRFCFVKSLVDVFIFGGVKIGNPLKIKTKLAQISWIESSPFIPSDSPSSTRIDEDEDVELQPYGSTTLRMTELPLIK